MNKLTKENYEEAINYMNKAIAIHPDSAVYYDNLSLAYQAMKNYSESRKNLEKALSLDPGNAGYINSIGLSYYYEKNYPRAIEFYNKAVEIDQTETYYDNLGLAYEEMNDYKNARSNYEKALAISSRKDYFLNLIGLMYYYDDHMPDAIIHYKKAIDFNNKDAVYWSNLALAYHVAGNLVEAEKAAIKAAAIDGSEVYQTRLADIKKLAKEKAKQK